MNTQRLNQLCAEFQKVILNLQSGTTVTISKKWATNNGISITSSECKEFGRYFAKNYQLFGCCKDNTVSPTQGTASNKDSKHLSHYIKN